jgi:hypothetical protein
MTTWDGRGLPPAAQARIERFGSNHVRTSLLSVPAAASLDHVGFDTVGEVMGCMVSQISWTGWGGCGYFGYGGGMGGVYGRGYGGWKRGTPFGTLGTPPMTSTVPPAGTTRPSSGGGYSGFAPYVDGIHAGYDTALQRMLLEAAAIGADGVVGVRLSVNHLSDSTREFVALGTAVRARSISRPAAVFSTDLSGTDVAKLLLAGWVPVAVQVAFEIAIRHDDFYTRQQASQWYTNTEVSGYTELVQHTRMYARDQWARKIAHLGAEGAVVSDMNLRIWEMEPAEGHRDHVAEALIKGTAIARFRHGPTSVPRTLGCLPLKTRATEAR